MHRKTIKPNERLVRHYQSGMYEAYLKARDCMSLARKQYHKALSPLAVDYRLLPQLIQASGDADSKELVCALVLIYAPDVILESKRVKGGTLSKLANSLERKASAISRDIKHERGRYQNDPRYRHRVDVLIGLMLSSAASPSQ